jgi:hypothetical protein
VDALERDGALLSPSSRRRIPASSAASTERTLPRRHADRYVLHHSDVPVVVVPTNGYDGGRQSPAA